MNNIITREQWEQIASAIKLNSENSGQPDDVIYTSIDKKGEQSRHYIYDNYDRLDSPGFDFVIHKDCNTGRLTVYNGSEQTYAPIDFEKGLEIANNFFNEKGSLAAEEIVCDYVMDGSSMISLWDQAAYDL